MVFVMENPMNKWMIWGVLPLLFGNTQKFCMTHDGSMGRMVYLYTYMNGYIYRNMNGMVDFYGKLVATYTMVPWILLG